MTRRDVVAMPHPVATSLVERGWPVAACLVVGAASVRLDRLLEGNESVILIVLFGLAAAIPFLVSRARGFDLGEPIYLVTIWYFVAFPLRAAFILAFPDDATYLGKYYYLDYITPALRLSLVGFVCVLVAYYSPIGGTLGRRVPGALGDFAGQRLYGRTAGVALIGVVAWAYLLFVVHRVHGLNDSFNYNDAEGVVTQLILFPAYAASLAGIIIFGREKRLRPTHILFLLAIAAPTIYVAIAFARRYVLITAAVGFVFAWHYRRRPISLRHVVLVAGVFLCIVFPLIQVSRSGGVASVGGAGVDSSVARARTSAHQLFGNGFAAYRHLTLDVVMNRMNGIDTLAGVLKETPAREPFLGGHQYLSAPAIALIPRALWPGKPRVDFAQTFAPTYFGSTNYQTHVVTFNTPDLYLNFGVVGVVIGSLIIGVLYRVLYTWLKNNGGRPSEIKVFCYTFLFLFLCFVEWSFSTIIVSIARAIPFWLIIVWAMSTSTRARAETRHA